MDAFICRFFFTFQSGYIQIIAGYGVVNYMQNFTFQSGYIQIH